MRAYFKHGGTKEDVAAFNISLHILSFCFQVMSHNKERRSKRDEKLDKKSQAMEELKAEREKKKNKTGRCVFHPFLMGSKHIS